MSDPITVDPRSRKGVTATFRSMDGRDYVELKIIGDSNTSIQKVTPAHVERFPREWDAYKRETPQEDFGGTPLSELPGITAEQVLNYKFRGVHNVEMMADLSDGQVGSLGLGTQALRKIAKLVLSQAAADKAKAPAPKEKVAA